MDEAFFQQELKSFLDAQGRLTRYPAKRKPKMTALCYLATKFEADREYTERQVNEVLKQWHTFSDWCMLRRDLYDLGLFGRANNGSTYWLEARQPTVEELMER